MTRAKKTPAPPVKWKPSSATQFVVGGITAILTALFIFSTTNGDIVVAGDDRWMISHVLPLSWNYFKYANRGYIGPFYTLIFDMNGQSSQRTHLFFFALFVLSGLLFYFLLHKLLGVVPALLGTIFYLGYVGKHEIITWMSAGGYSIVVIALFLSVYIALSDRFGPWTRAVSIAIINWMAVFFYEILLVVAPLYPLFYWLNCRLRRRPVEFSALAATFLPLLIFFVHISVMLFSPYGEPQLLPWQRGSTPGSMGLSAALARIWPTFTASFSAGMGRDHFLMLTQQIQAFREFVAPDSYATLTALGACAGVAFLLWFAPFVRLDKAVVVPLLIAGAYLALFSPMIGLTTNPGFVPSRLLTLVAVGLSILTSVAVSFALSMRTPIVRYGIPIVLLAAGGLEAVAMNSILYEHQIAWAYDSRIRTQLLASGIRPQPGDTIFISLPPHPADLHGRLGFSQFEGGHIQMILTADFGLLREHQTESPLLYQHEVRNPGVPPIKPVGKPGHQLFCFSVSANDLQLTRTDCETR